jgi:nucleotide-binding universal stress UspA family protein
MKYMVCTDGEKSAAKAIEVAAQFAKISNSDLLILHVIASEVSRATPDYDSYGTQTQKAQTIINKALEITTQFAPEITVSTRIAVGPVSAEIVRIAEEEGIAGIFIGTIGSSKLKKLLLGNVTDDVIHYAHCPVTLVR